MLPSWETKRRKILLKLSVEMRRVREITLFKWNNNLENILKRFNNVNLFLSLMNKFLAHVLITRWISRGRGVNLFQGRCGLDARHLLSQRRSTIKRHQINSFRDKTCCSSLSDLSAACILVCILYIHMYM